MLTLLDEADAVVLPHDAGRRRRHGREREVVRQAVVVGLLGLPQEVSRVEDGVVGLDERGQSDDGGNYC